MQGSEAHDQLLGRVFGYAAVIRAGHIQEGQLASRCATALIGIANKKSFLPELAAHVVLELTGEQSCNIRSLFLFCVHLGVAPAAQ